MPVPPIQSSDVEESIEHCGFDRDSFWAKFFAKALSQSAMSPLYQGKWSLTNKNQYIETSPHDLPAENPSVENRVGFYQTRPLYLDWGSAGNYAVMALKSMPDAQNGRVKWWRKKVKEGNCPPVLIWFITCLQAYVVLDGHARLRAFQLERQKPDYMVLKSVNEIESEPDLERAKMVQQSLVERQLPSWKKPLSVDDINKILIKVYDNRPFVNHTTKSLAIPDFEPLWLKEVKAFEGKPGTDQEELDTMLLDT